MQIYSQEILKIYFRAQWFSLLRLNMVSAYCHPSRREQKCEPMFLQLEEQLLKR